MNVKLIRDQIKNLGLVQNRLARRIDVHPNTLSNFLTGKSVLGTEALLKLLSILNMKPEALLDQAS